MEILLFASHEYVQILLDIKTNCFVSFGDLLTASTLLKQNVKVYKGEENDIHMLWKYLDMIVKSKLHSLQSGFFYIN